jgi:hypothetical protein
MNLGLGGGFEAGEYEAHALEQAPVVDVVTAATGRAHRGEWTVGSRGGVRVWERESG